MLAYGEAAIHNMDGFHLQNVRSRTRTSPRTGLLMIRDHRGVPLGLIRDAIRGSSNGSEYSSGVACEAKLLAASTESLVLPSRFLAAFPLLEHYCSNRYLCVPVPIEIVWGRVKTLKKRKRTKLGKDRRRKHKHWQVTVFYKDGEKFARVYTDRAKASKFAERQRKSPVVKTARVLQVS